MGQKINPVIFQLSKTSNWQSKCFEKKVTEYSKYSKKDLEIRHFVEKFFKNHHRIVHQCKICYFEKSLHIFVSYQLNAQSPLIFLGGLPGPSRFKIRKRWKEPCKVLQSYNFRTTIVKSYIKEMFYRISRYSMKGVKFVKFKILNKMLHYLILWYKKCVGYFKKAFQILSTVIREYKKIKNKSILDATTHLIKPIRLLRKLTWTLYHKKLRGKDEEEQKRVGQLKSMLTEKMTDSLRYFTSKNLTLWIHTQALNLNRSKEVRKKVKDILKKNLIKLRKYKEEKFYREGIETLLTCSTTRKPSALLAQFISVQLKALKKHNFFLKFIKDGLKLFNTNTLSNKKRIKIKIRGRLNARPKAKRRVLIIRNDVSVLTVCSIIDYSKKTAFTSNGTLGIKVWTHEFSN